MSEAKKNNPETNDDTIDSLINLGFYGDLSIDENLKSKFGMKYKQGDVIIEEGKDDKDLYVYLILTGIVDVLRKHNDEEKVISTLGPGEVVGEMAFIEGTKRSATVKARTDLEVIALSETNFGEIFRISPFWPMKLIKSLSNRIMEHLN